MEEEDIGAGSICIPPLIVSLGGILIDFKTCLVMGLQALKVQKKQTAILYKLGIVWV